jgi:extracellular factor (EF) 3-hydroxypalmitic acid methyl ester biosynthesis protein
MCQNREIPLAEAMRRRTGAIVGLGASGSRRPSDHPEKPENTIMANKLLWFWQARIVGSTAINSMAPANSDVKESLVVCQTNQGVEIHATLLRLSRYQAVCEVYGPNLVVQTSEALQDFRIIVFDRTVYHGRAVVSNLINAGAVLVLEIKLDEAAFLAPSLTAGEANGGSRGGFEEFLGEWQNLYKVKPEFKVVVADMQTFLTDLRLWLDQVELEIRAAPAGDRWSAEREYAQKFGAAMVPAFNSMHERLEALSEDIEEELRPVHQVFAKRLLHPLVMCSPFAYRTYHKPLGYAGDYEMVSMILRDPYEGSSLFAKVVNLWFLSQWPAQAHRNRIRRLKELLAQESLRGLRRGRPIRVLNLGCGPAFEIQEFLGEDSLSDHAQFTLLDFNDETLQHTHRTLDDLNKRHGRRATIQLQRKSVNQLLKEASKSAVHAPDKKFDFIYCAGLFDYLSDRTCKQLMNVFYDWLAPGGMQAVTNVDSCKPFRHMLEFVLDWHLVYRDTKKGAALLPAGVAAEDACIRRDPTQVNLFIELRKPDHA